MKRVFLVLFLLGVNLVALDRIQDFFQGGEQRKVPQPDQINHETQNQTSEAEMAKRILPEYFSQTLKNGIQIYVIPIQNGSGVIETNVFYKVGSRNEVMGKSGIAHMLEHLNFKSTKNLKAGEFDEIVKKFGGVTNASTSFDYTRYFVKSSVQNLDKSLELFAELLQNVKLEDNEFQPERDVVAEERRWRTDNSPIGYLYFRLFNTAYVYHPYHWTPIGFTDDIKNWQIKDIQAFHKIYYQPKNAIIVIAGDIDPQTAFQSVATHFEDIPNLGGEIPNLYTIEPKQDGARHIEINRDSEVQYYALAYKIPNFKHKDQVVLNVLAELLSGGKSSLLRAKLVDQDRLATEVSSYAMDLRDEGVFLFIASGNEGIEAERLQSGIEEILQNIRLGKITQKQIDKAKANIRASFIYSLEDASSVASLFGEYLAKGDLKPLIEYEKRLEDIKVSDVINVARKYFVKQGQTSVFLRR